MARLKEVQERTEFMLAIQERRNRTVLRSMHLDAVWPLLPHEICPPNLWEFVIPALPQV